jgi:transcriptional regulator with XRE-family HTH domain
MGRGKTPETPIDVITMRNNILFLFGQNVRAARVKKGMNQSDLNRLLGYTVNNSRLSKIENGDLRSMSITTMIEVAYHLGIKIEVKLLAADKPKERKEVTFEKKESKEPDQKARIEFSHPEPPKEEVKKEEPAPEPPKEEVVKKEEPAQSK